MILHLIRVLPLQLLMTLLSVAAVSIREALPDPSHVPDSELVMPLCCRHICQFIHNHFDTPNVCILLIKVIFTAFMALHLLGYKQNPYTCTRDYTNGTCRYDNERTFLRNDLPQIQRRFRNRQKFEYDAEYDYGFICAPQVMNVNCSRMEGGLSLACVLASYPGILPWSRGVRA